MFDDLENKIGHNIGQAPLIARLFFSYELTALNDSLSQSAALRSSYKPTEQWYIDYGKNLNKGYDALYHAVDRAYTMYYTIKNIPIIGEPISNWLEDYAGIALSRTVPMDFMQKTPTQPIAAKFRLPQKTTTLNMLNSMHTLAIEGICAYYESTTNQSAESIRQEINYQPQPYVVDPSPFRGAFIEAAQCIGTFFNEIFGISQNYEAASY